MTAYRCTDGNGDVDITADSPREAAQEFVDGGDWGETEKTFWVTVRVTPLDAEGEEVEDESDSYTIAVEPEVPECSEGAHDWQSPLSVVGGIKSNPGVHGHGGGVIVREVCAHCGAYQITDTWDQDRATGRQGFRSVRYEPANAKSEAWLREQETE